MSLIMTILNDIFFMGLGFFFLWKSIKYFFEAAELDSFTTLLCSIILFLWAGFLILQTPIGRSMENIARYSVDKPSANTCAPSPEQTRVIMSEHRLEPVNT